MSAFPARPDVLASEDFSLHYFGIPDKEVRAFWKVLESMPRCTYFGRNEPIPITGLMTDRFQLRRWPDGCPPLIGELAVVDTNHRDRIVRTYRDGPEGGALVRSKADISKWNAAPPELRMRYRAPEIIKHRNPDGTITCGMRAIEPRFFDESSYADYEYVNL